MKLSKQSSLSKKRLSLQLQGRAVPVVEDDPQTVLFVTALDVETKAILRQIGDHWTEEAAQQFSRFRSEADIEPDLGRPGMNVALRGNDLEVFHIDQPMAALLYRRLDEAISAPAPYNFVVELK